MSYVRKFLNSFAKKPSSNLASFFGSNNMEISQAIFIFQVPNFGKDNITVSPTAYVRNLPWTIIVQLNETDEEDDTNYSSMSVFVQCDCMMHSNWSCNAEISINLLSSNSNNYETSFEHCFNRKECVTGIDPFISRDLLIAPLNGYIEDNKIVLEVTMKCDEPKSVPWNSKKHTRFVGLESKTEKNSYLNSIIQILYSIEPFRTLIGDLCNDFEIHDVIWEMRQIFRRLSVSDVPVSTDQFIKSIGCGTYNAIKTHDTEFFFDYIFKILQKYPVTQEIWNLFQGQMSVVSKSTSKLEITKFRQLKGLKLKICGDADINELLLAHFAAIESDTSNTVTKRRSGVVNRYQITQLPSILILHLDRQQDSKLFVIEHRKDMKFSKSIDLSDFARNSDDSSARYVLHAVLVQSDTFSAFIRQCHGIGWLKFDDNVVSHCTETEAIEDNFRCVQMLVYLKCSGTMSCSEDKASGSRNCNVDKAIVDCVICMEVRKGSVIFSTVCGHVFCGPCIKKEIALRQKCPVCNKGLTDKEIHPIFI